MYYDNLNIGLQNIIMYNYETFFRIILVLFLIFYSFYYVFVINKNTSKPDSSLVYIYRVITYSLSIIVCWTSPFILIFFVNPIYNIDTIFSIYYIYYSFLIIYTTIIIFYFISVDVINVIVNELIIKKNTDLVDLKNKVKFIKQILSIFGLNKKTKK